MVFSAPVGLAQEAPAAPPAAAPPAAEPRRSRAALTRRRPHPRRPKPSIPNHVVIPIVLARELRDEPLPLSLLDLPPKDLGIAGAKLAITDNNTTGRFMNQEFKLDVIENADPAKLIAGSGPEGGRRRALHHRRRHARDASQDGRRDQGQGSDPHQLQRRGRQPARGELPAAGAAHGADALDADRRARPVPRLEEVAALAARARADREGQALRRGAAPLRQALRRQDRRGAHLQLRLRQPAHRWRLRAGAAADPDLHAERARL